MLVEIYILIDIITSAYILYNERKNKLLNKIIWLFPNILFCVFYFPVYFLVKGYINNKGEQAVNIWLRISISCFLLLMVFQYIKKNLIAV